MVAWLDGLFKIMKLVQSKCDFIQQGMTKSASYSLLINPLLKILNYLKLLIFWKMKGMIN